VRRIRQHPCSPIVTLVVLALTLAACADDEAFEGDGERAAQPSSTVDTDLAALLEDHRSEEYPGMVLLVGDRDETFLVASGVADLDTGNALRTDDRFRIASTSKPMVAAALLTFVDAGRLGLDDSAADHLPSGIVDRLANADQATVRQLLQMTSGIPEYLDADAFWVAVERDPAHFWTPEEVLEYADGLPAEHAPGSGFHYSNSNYVLAQLILEELSAQPLAQVLQDVVFEPAGMTGCSLETADTFADDMVRGYDLGVSGDLVDVTEINDGVGLGDGGVVCRAESLVRFLPALVAGEILGEDTLAAMLDGVPAGSGAIYGLGIDVDHDDEFGLTIGHDGASSGFQSVLLYVPDDDLSVAVLTNSMALDLPPELPDELLGWWFDRG